jgi:hypothetical protein
MYLFLTFRIKNFCGSIADMVGSKSNIVHIRYYAEASAINSIFSISYTAFREKGSNGNNVGDGRQTFYFTNFSFLSTSTVLTDDEKLCVFAKIYGHFI